MASKSEVMEALGRAVFAAQNFEINVGTLVLVMAVEVGNHEQFLDASGQRDVEAVKTFIDQVDRLTLGQLKGKLESMNGLAPDMIAQIDAVNRIRKRLMHYFVTDFHNEMATDEGRDEILSSLLQQEDEIRSAWISLQNFVQEKTANHIIFGQ